MTAFTLHLHDATRSQRIDGVTSFIGEDASGSFGILAGHARFMTALGFGLMRYRCGEDPWQYLAVPGGLLYFRDNTLTISTRHYLISDDYERICQLLQEQLLAEEDSLQTTKENLHTMEQEMFKQLWAMRRQDKTA
ncbi:MAG: F0F1 ATP synthase subunit epsilon [Gammaproteobacteria bacterium]